MKSRLLLAILAAGCFSAEVRSDAVLAITEINESLTVTFNGSGPFGTITELGPESWDVQLPTGYTFLNAIVGGTFFVSEPENALEVNTVTIRDSTTLNWVGDVPVPVTAATGFDNPFVLADGGTLPDQKCFRFDAEGYHNRAGPWFHPPSISHGSNCAWRAPRQQNRLTLRQQNRLTLRQLKQGVPGRFGGVQISARFCT